jgi:hypothetical protein
MAFVSLFGTTVDDYHQEFDQHWQELFPNRITGQVIAPGSRPVPNVFLQICGITNEECRFATTADNGRFIIAFSQEGDYTLYFFLGDQSGYYTADGVTNDPTAASLIEVRSQTPIDLTVALPAYPGIPPTRYISGKITDVNGVPFAGVSVGVCPAIVYPPSPLRGSCRGTDTLADGSYRVGVPDNDRYWIGVVMFSPDGTARIWQYILTSHGAVPGHSEHDSPDITIFRVSGSDLTGIDIQIPELSQ